MTDATVLPAAAAAGLGRTLVLAPHPDDETLACGGLIALLARAGVPLRVVLLSDGAGSHRQSLAFPATRLAALRLQEMTAALRELGLAAHHLVTLGWPDGAVPQRGEPGFGAALRQLSAVAGAFRPDTVLMPSRHDEHPDHRATHHLGTACCERAAGAARRLEYTVWGRPPPGRAWRIDVSATLAAKQRALACHRSQLGQVVTDDPDGFTLPAELLARCMLPVESYVETRQPIQPAEGHDGHR